jgi:hypothetical protein
MDGRVKPGHDGIVIASSRSLSSGRPRPDPVALRNDEKKNVL